MEEMVIDSAVGHRHRPAAVRKDDGTTPEGGVESRWSSTSSVESDLENFWHDSTALNHFYTTEDTINTLDSFDFNDDGLFLGPFNSCSTGLSYPTQDSARHMTEASAAGIESIDFARTSTSMHTAAASETLLPFPDNDDLLFAPSLSSSSWLDGGSGDFSLKHRLNSALTRGDGGRLFVPDDAIKSLVTHEAVAAELQMHWPGMPLAEVQQLAHQIAAVEDGDGVGAQIPATGMLRTFAALVVLGQVHKVMDFIQEGLSDCALPLIKCGAEGGQGLRRRDAPGVPLGRLGSWSQSEIDGFEQVQWRFLSPVFTNIASAKDEDEQQQQQQQADEVEFLDLQDQAVLPYVESWQDKKQDHYKGGNSEVWKVKIHDAHHSFRNIHTALVPGHSAFFAIKKLKSKDDEAFRREVRNLQRLHNAEHPNLLSLLATYKYRGYYHLVFPWADGGDLRRLWQSTPHPPAGKEEMRWLASQCASIASALRSVHAGAESWMQSGGASDKQQQMAMNKFGLHGDIKPENIFIFAKGQQKSSFKAGGLAMGPPKTAATTTTSSSSLSSSSSSSIEDLVIGDFGGGDFFDASSNPDPLKQLTVTYRPPEYDTKLRPISRSWDVWGLGCTYLEFVTWFLLGPSGLVEFAKRRTTRTAAGKLSDEYFETFLDKNSSSHDGGGMMMGATLKESVLGWIHELYRHKNASPFIRDFLDFITHRMFIVENAWLTRASGEEVAEHLAQLMRKCFDSDAYCLPGPTTTDALNHFDFAAAAAASFSVLEDDHVMAQSWNTAPIVPCLYNTTLSCADLLGPSSSLSWNFTAPATAGLGKRKRQIEDVTDDGNDDEEDKRHKTSPTGDSLTVAAALNSSSPMTSEDKTVSSSPQTVIDSVSSISGSTTESPPTTTTTTVKRFACPFFKHNPAKFRHKRTCCGPGWPTVHRVKEHLYRCHTIGKHTCSRCLQRCGSAAELLAHQRAATPCEARADAFAEGSAVMLPSQEEALRVKRRVPAGVTEEARWREVYAVVFPGVKEGVIPTPYYEDEPTPHRDEEEMRSKAAHNNTTTTPSTPQDSWFCNPADYEAYLSRSLPSRAQRELERQVQSEFGFFGDATQTRRVVEMVQAMQLRLFRQFRDERRT